MHIFTRKFHATKLGRAVGTVNMQDPSYADVEILALQNPIPPQRFRFPLAELVTVNSAHDIRELALRIAIANCQIAVDHTGGEHTTLCTTRPWIGDLSAAGSDALIDGDRVSASAADRRHEDGALGELVDRGLKMRLSEGRFAARQFLQRANVPPSVIRRVLSNTTRRRKP